jgi:hypothetical protein
MPTPVIGAYDDLVTSLEQAAAVVDLIEGAQVEGANLHDNTVAIAALLVGNLIQRARDAAGRLEVSHAAQ